MLTTLTATAALASVRPGAVLTFAPGDYGTLVVPPVPCTLRGTPGAKALFRLSATSGFAVNESVHIEDFAIDGGGTQNGISGIDGTIGLAVTRCRIENCLVAFAIQQSDGSLPPNDRVTLSQVRARNCVDMGVSLGQTWGAKVFGFWGHRIGSTYTGPDRQFRHVTYWNDHSVGGGVAQDVWATGSATGLRGTLAECIRPIVEGCDNGIAASLNCHRLVRPAISGCPVGGCLGLSSLVPCWIHEPLIRCADQTSRGLEIGSGARMPYLQVRGGMIYGFPRWSSLNIQAQIDRADFTNLTFAGSDPQFREDVNWGQDLIKAPDGSVLLATPIDRSKFGFHNCLSIRMDAASGDPTRTLERWAREVKGFASLDALWESDTPIDNTPSDWIYEGVGL